MTDQQLIDKVNLLGIELARTTREFDAAKDLIGVLLAEIAYSAPPEERLHRLTEIIEGEKTGVYNGVVEHDELTPSLTKTLMVKDAWKRDVYERAEHILERVDLARS